MNAGAGDAVFMGAAGGETVMTALTGLRIDSALNVGFGDMVRTGAGGVMVTHTGLFEVAEGAHMTLDGPFTPTGSGHRESGSGDYHFGRLHRVRLDRDPHGGRDSRQRGRECVPGGSRLAWGRMCLRLRQVRAP